MTLTDGRGELYQWDTGRTLTVDDATVTQVHFQNRAYGRTIDVDVKDGTAIIPDEILQKPGDLRVYAFSGTAASGFTKVERVFNVVRRNKPNDYMFTPTEQKSLEGLQKQIGDLSDLKTDAKTDIVAAINETATAGQTLGLTGAIVGQVPTVKSVDGNGVPTEWEAVTDSTPFIVEFNGGGITEWPYTSSHTFEQITVAISAGRYVIGHAEELMVSGDPSGGRYNIYFDLVSTMDVAIFQFVDASNHYQINVAIPNVENASVNVFGSYLSASSSTYGGVKADSAEGTDTQPVRIGTDGKLYTAPGSSGGSTDTSLGLTGATVGQTVKIKAVDENGIPTEWEAADAASGEDWEFINEISTNEWISSVTINQDSNGNPFSLKKMRIFMTLPKTTNEAGEEQTNAGYAYYAVNDRRPTWQNPSNGWNNALFLWTIEAMGDYYTVTCFKDGANGAQLWHSDVFKSEGAFRTITKFEWRMFNGTMGWSSTNFKVYGVRA